MRPCITAHDAKTKEPWCSMTHVSIWDGKVLYAPEYSVGVILFAEDGHPILEIAETSDNDVLNLFIKVYGDKRGFFHYPNQKAFNSESDEDSDWDLITEWSTRPSPINPLPLGDSEVHTKPKQIHSKGKCDFCDKPLPNAKGASLDDWIPTYWSEADNEEIFEPVCGECVKKYLEYDKDSCDFVRKIQPTSRPAS